MNGIQQQKQAIRQRIRLARRREENRESQAQAIFERLRQRSEWNTADSLLYHVGVRDEVPTLTALQHDIEAGRSVAIPWCKGEELSLCCITSLEQLIPGAFGILEPASPLRAGDAVIAPERIDLALIPGLVFDRLGNRLGYGRGYFDRLLARFRRDCLKVGLAFDCQIVDVVPSQSHDQPVDLIVTPTQIIDCGADSRSDP